MDLITWSDEFRTKLAEALGIQASEIRNHTTLEYFDVIVTIIWSPELYKNNMVTHSFPCLLSSYLLRNVKIAQREL